MLKNSEQPCKNCDKPIQWLLVYGWIHIDTGSPICGQTKAEPKSKD